jgi:NhaA family Na+:H+ antiporter
MPLFAFANTAILLPSNIGFLFTSTISLGIIVGLVIGKPLGIFLFSFIACRLKIAALPASASWKQILGVGMLSGIGFTMSIFTATLSYSENASQIISKVAIIAASVISGILGFVYLYKLKASVFK